MAEEIISIYKAETAQYRAQIKELDSDLEKLDKSERELEGTRKKSNDTKPVEAYNKKLEDSKERTETVSKATDDLKGRVDRFTGGAISGFTKWIKTITGATKGFNLLKVAIASTGIGALVLVVGTLITYFTQTQRGIDLVDQALAGFRATIDVFTDRASALGETLVGVFQDPGSAAEALGEAIKNFISRRIQALTEGVEGLGSAFALLFDGEFAKAAEKAGESVFSLAKAVDPLTIIATESAEALKGLGEEILNEASAAIELEERLQALKLREIELTAERERARGELKRFNQIAEDTTKSLEERTAAAEKTIQIERELQRESLSIAQERLDIITQQNALGETLNEDLLKQKEAEADLNRIKQESIEILTTQTNKFNILNDQMQKQLGLVNSMADAESNLAKIQSKGSESFQSNIDSANEKLLEQRNIVVEDRQAEQAYIDSENSRLEEEAAREDQLRQNEANEALNLANSLTAIQVQTSEARLAMLQNEYANASDIQKESIGKQIEAEKQKLENFKVLQLTANTINEAVAIGRAYAELGPVAGSIAALGLVVKFIAQKQQIENAQAFHKGTKFVQLNGNPMGRDTVPAYLDYGEAVIPTKQNAIYRDAVGSIIDGNFEKFIQKKYVIPALQKAQGGKAQSRHLPLIHEFGKSRRSEKENFDRLIRAVQSGNTSARHG